MSSTTRPRRAVARRLPGPSRVRLGLHRADRRGGVATESPPSRTRRAERRGDAGGHGRAADHDVRRHHRAGDRDERAHGRGAANLVGLPAGAEQKTAISQIGLAAFGEGVAFYLLQASPPRSWSLAANTAFNGFPVLSSLLGRDDYLPHQFANRGDRLVFWNGIVLLALVAGLLIVAFNATSPPDPALHPRRVRLVHAQPGRNGPPLDRALHSADRRVRDLRRKQSHAVGAVATALSS